MPPTKIRKRVLIADDDRQLVDSLASHLERCGLHVQRAYDARTTLRTVLDGFPDLICIDVDMPAGNGMTACEVLAKDEEASRIPVIVMTGRGRRACRPGIELCAYYLKKSANLWPRIRPIVEELVDVEMSRLTD